MAVTSWIRRQFKDGVITTATTTMTAGATSFSVGGGQGVTFPDGTIGPFIVTVDQGQAAEEKILVQSRTSDTFTVATNGRGYNGTTAQAHSNAVVLHTIDAQDFDEANQVAVQTLGAVTASGDLLQGSGANALSRLARGTTGQVLQAGASLLSWVGFAVGQSQAVGSANADGTQTTMCHPDHVHAGVTSFNTRQGVVSPASGDYTAAQVTNAADKSSASQQVFTGEVKAPDFLPAGLTGATAASRYVGATASGAPASGTFAVGDFVIDQTGAIWVCTGAGTPGTWGKVGPNANPAGRMYPTAQTILTSGTTGQITSMTSDFLKGGVTFGSNGLTVPVAGIYVVAAGIAWQNSSNPIAGGIYNTAIFKNGGQARLWTVTNDATPSNFNQAFGSDLISLAAGDVLTLEGTQGSGGSAGTVTGVGGGTYLSVALVSQ